MSDLQDIDYAATLTADEVLNLLTEVDRLRASITEHQVSVTYQAKDTLDQAAADRRLWSVLDGGASDA